MNSTRILPWLPDVFASLVVLVEDTTEVFTKDDCKNNSFCDKKIYGFMVDLNPQRVLSTLNYIQQNNSNKLDSTEDEYITVADTMNIDRDIFINKFDEPYTNDDEKKKAIKKFSEEFFQNGSCGRAGSRSCLWNKTGISFCVDE